MELPQLMEASREIGEYPNAVRTRQDVCADGTVHLPAGVVRTGLSLIRVHWRGNWTSISWAFRLSLGTNVC